MLRVLLAEDSGVGRLVFQRAVEALGHTCIVAADGLHAWELFQLNLPDVVIGDWMLPGLDGPGLCRRIRSRPDTPYASFVLLSPQDQKESAAVEGIQAGADGYLTRPIDPLDLRLCLLAAERMVKLHRSLQQKTIELEHAYNELFATSRTDALTRVGNRLRLHEDLSRLEAEAERYGRRFSIAMCDLDHFKTFNDSMGHLAGDTALRAVAQVISRESRNTDMVYRYGGEELAVIMTAQALQAAGTAMERLRKAVEARRIEHPASPTAPYLTISVGVAQRRPGDASDGRDILHRADAALYRAKAGGRNQVCLEAE